MIREDLVRRLAGGEKPFDYDIDRIFDHYVSLDKKRRKAKRGIVSMCIGGGMGAAGIYEML